MSVEDYLSCLSMGCVAGLGLELILSFAVYLIGKVISSVINS